MDKNTKYEKILKNVLTKIIKKLIIAIVDDTTIKKYIEMVGAIGLEPMTSCL